LPAAIASEEKPRIVSGMSVRSLARLDDTSAVISA
jgi:hypothetical protein